MNSLPANAERYLRALDAALWPLGSDERETILLELRSHLAGCAAVGPVRLADALESLGSPEECAAAFVLEGAGDVYGKAGLPGRALVPVAPPAELAEAVRPRRLGAVLRDVRATWRASGDQLWTVGAVVLTVSTATNFLSYIHLLQPGSLEIWPILLVRLVMVLAAFTAAYRTILTDEGNAWSVNLATFKAGLAIAGLFLILFAAAAATKALLGIVDAPRMVRVAVLIALLLGSSLLFLRVQPWIAGLAIDRRDATLRRILVGLRGRMGAVAKGWAAIVLPLALLHYASALVVAQSDAVHPFHLLLAGIDGIVSMALVIGAALVNATAFRWAMGEPIPGPRPFATGMPDDALIEQARVRLQRHIEARGG